MLSPRDLLGAAAELAARIPLDAAYEEERNAAWKVVGEGWLKLGDCSRAVHALGNLTEPQRQADLRHAICLGLNEHPGDPTALGVLRDTASHIAYWDEWLSYKEMRELIPIVNSALVDDDLHRSAAQFLAQFADNRNLVKYESWFEERFPDLFADPVEPAVRPSERANRILEYRANDLKLRLLTDIAQSGDVADEELESLLASERFRRIEPPRARGIHRAPPLTNDAFADFFFNRPVPIVESDKKLLEGDDFTEDVDPGKFVECGTHLFRHFGEIAGRYSPGQIDQGLWFLFSYPFTFGDALFKSDVPFDAQLDCLGAMLCPYRDYYARMSGQFEGTYFYMWWDTLFYSKDKPPEIEHAAIEVLKQILALPDNECQAAALHGMNHLAPNPEAAEAVSRHLEVNRERMRPEEIVWVEACRDGKAR